MLCNNKEYVYVKVCGKTVSWEYMFFVMSQRASQRSLVSDHTPSKAFVTPSETALQTPFFFCPLPNTYKLEASPGSLSRL